MLRERLEAEIEMLDKAVTVRKAFDAIADNHPTTGVLQENDPDDMRLLKQVDDAVKDMRDFQAIGIKFKIYGRDDVSNLVESLYSLIMKRRAGIMHEATDESDTQKFNDEYDRILGELFSTVRTDTNIELDKYEQYRSE